MSEPERRRALPLAALVAAVLFAAAFAMSLWPWLTRERTFVSSTPTTMPAFEISEVPLPRRSLLCVRGFGLDPTAEGLQLAVSDLRSAAASPPLQVEVTAPGYRSVARLAGGYAFNVPVVVPLRPPEREVDGAQACIRNEGRTVALLGTALSRELASVKVRLDGRTITPQPWLTFVQRPGASVLSQRTEILDRVAAFRPFPAVPVLLGLLALLVVLGVPLAVVGALALAERADSAQRD